MFNILKLFFIKQSKYINKKLILSFIFYFISILLLTFYLNPSDVFFKIPINFCQETNFKGDVCKFIRLAYGSLNGQFIPPITHTPGLQVINIFLLWISPQFPTLIFLSFLNSFLWALLLTQLYYLGQQRFNIAIAFIFPVFLLAPSFIYNSFFNSWFIMLGSSITAVSLNIGFIFIIISIQNNNIKQSIISGLFLAFSAYIWSLTDTIVTYISLISLFLIVCYFVWEFCLQRKNFLSFIREIHFSIISNILVTSIIFWGLTFPYRLYMKSLTMVPSGEVWQRIWQLPLYWIEPKFAGNWVFQGGGFPFCRAYPEICQKLHQQVEFHNNIYYLKNLAYKTFMENPWILLKWKMPFLVRYWENLYPLENQVILSFLPLTFLLWLVKPQKLTGLVFLFSFLVFSLTISILLLAHIETRYFYTIQFTLCVGLLLNFLLLFPRKR